MRNLNLVTIGLLAAILVATIAMPRFNYRALALRQAALELENDKLEVHMRRLEQVTGLERDGAHVTALVETLKSIPELLQATQNEISALQALPAALPRRIDDLARRVKALEDGTAAARMPGMDGLPAFDELQPLDLSPELRERADRFSPRATAEGEFEGFLSHAVDAGLLRGLDQLEPETNKALFRLFSLYKLNIGLINYAENLHVRELVEEAAEAGHYVEVPIVTDDETLRRVAVSEGGIVHVQTLRAQGVRRIYRFTAEEFPEFAEYNRQRDNARDHIVKDVAALMEAGPATGGE